MSWLLPGLPLPLAAPAPPANDLTTISCRMFKLFLIHFYRCAINRMHSSMPSVNRLGSAYKNITIKSGIRYFGDEVEIGSKWTKSPKLTVKTKLWQKQKNPRQNIGNDPEQEEQSEEATVPTHRSISNAIETVESTSFPRAAFCTKAATVYRVAKEIDDLQREWPISSGHP